jgi:predicted metalloprotease
LIYAAEVYEDLQENINWYIHMQEGLGSRFFKAVKEQFRRIQKNPYTVAVRYDDIRCAKVKKFPYLVHFEIFQDQNVIKIIAVFSTHRDPKVWEERTENKT